MSTAVGRLRLDELKVKPIPNKKQKQGVLAIFGPEDQREKGKKVEKVEKGKEEKEKEKEREDEKEEQEDNDKEKSKKPTIVFEDARATSQLDRKRILETMTARNIFSVVKDKNPSQMPEGIEEPDVKPAKKMGKLTVVAEESSEESKKGSTRESEEKDTETEEPEEGEGDQDQDQDASEKEGDQEEEKEPTKKKRTKGPRNKDAEPSDYTKLSEDELETRIKGSTVETRILKAMHQPLHIVSKASPYYLNNRKLFLQKLAPLFAQYKRELSDTEVAASCEGRASANQEFELLTHQKVVSDYLGLYSPYRGLLLYHGLGSGKTCTSIAIAEGLKSKNRVFVMTLASLKTNFFSEMKKCGDVLYRKNQFWEFISTEGKPDYIPLLSKTLSISEATIRRNKGAWMVNMTKRPNFDSLADRDQIAVDAQLDEMIRAKYTDINYNGLNRAILDQLTSGFTKNPFDHSVVVIDEAHNFVSRIVNKMKVKNSISYKLYEYLMSATACRIVLLSGTPIINSPNEIGVLFNILRGYIKTWTFPVSIEAGAKEKPSRDNIMSWFDKEGLSVYDYVEYSGDEVVITRNPFGFVNVDAKPAVRAKKGVLKKGGSKSKKISAVSNRHTKKSRSTNFKGKPFIIEKGVVVKNPDAVLDTEESDDSETSMIHYDNIGPNGEQELRGGGFDDYKGVQLDETGNLSDADFAKRVVQILSSHGLTTKGTKIRIDQHKGLPDIPKEFLELFVELDTKEMKNEQVFQKRILGLTSYFRSADPALLPRFVPSDHDDVYHIVRCPMSDYQFGLYEKIRGEESKREKQNKKTEAQRAKKAPTGDAEELFKIASTYRIASRTCCNFAFPDPPGRPQKREGEYGGEEEPAEAMAEEDTIGPNATKKKMGGDDNGDFDEDMYGGGPKTHVIKRPKKTVRVVEVEVEVEKEEETKEEAKEEEKEEAKEEEEKHAKEDEEEDDNDSDEGETQDETEKREDSPEEGLDYNKRIQRALADLKRREEEIFSPEGLAMYSPKFLKILQNIQNADYEGLHLLYSQFRTMEGIGILKLVLEANGFAEFKIKKATASGEWSIEPVPEGQEGRPRFVLYTGTEEEKEKEIIRNIYNGSWDIVPSSITSELKKQGHENNRLGEVIKVFMITASGAEGINLKNTRYVHIVEPYWHMVRLQQVIGRARRICSHQELSEEMRTVQVFLYIATLTAAQKTDEKHIELRLRDVSRLSKKAKAGAKGAKGNVSMLDRYEQGLKTVPDVITTDQMLFENALVKDRVNSQILMAVKETAMDCSLYNKGNKDEKLVCYSFGKVSTNAFGSYPTLAQEVAEKGVQEVRETKVKLIKITIPNEAGVAKDYALNRTTKEVFDFADYQAALESGADLVRIGYMEESGRGQKKTVGIRFI